MIWASLEVVLQDLGTEFYGEDTGDSSSKVTAVNVL